MVQDHIHMKSVTASDILHQLKEDLIGKDSYRGVSLTYSWLANQFGHFSLGFIPTLLVYARLNKHYPSEKASLHAAMIVSATWLLFELFNFLGPLLLKKNPQAQMLPAFNKKYVFKPAWVNVGFDTVTDVAFFSWGAHAAGLMLHFSCALLWLVIILGVVLLYPTYYWYMTKIYVQRAQYPYQFRLSQFDLAIDDADKKIVESFVTDKTPGKHLFIFGSRGSGKTGLSIGIATEQSIGHHVCLYTTAMKLYSMFREPEPKVSTVNDRKDFWTWRNASLLIIDDINPGHPVADIVSPDKFIELLDAGSSSNRTCIKNKRIIWVLGNVDTPESYLKTWQEALKELEISAGDISFVSLK